MAQQVLAPDAPPARFWGTHPSPWAAWLLGHVVLACGQYWGGGKGGAIEISASPPSRQRAGEYSVPRTSVESQERYFVLGPIWT